jgi:hypothetical protein
MRSAAYASVGEAGSQLRTTMVAGSGASSCPAAGSPGTNRQTGRCKAMRVRNRITLTEPQARRPSWENDCRHVIIAFCTAV